MKRLSFWTAENVKPLFVLLVTISVLMIGASEALAYNDYILGCEELSRRFPVQAPTSSLSDGSNWPNDLHRCPRERHVGRRLRMSATPQRGKSPVFLDSSDGGERAELLLAVLAATAGTKTRVMTGLFSRTRRWLASAPHGHRGRNCGGCHERCRSRRTIRPVGEDVLPNYYANPGTGHPAMPDGSCNPLRAQRCLCRHSPLGLDNDGNGVYDTRRSRLCSGQRSTGGRCRWSYIAVRSVAP